MDELTRSGFLRGAAAGGAALAAGGALAALTATAAAAPTEKDLAWLRFGITVEAVSVEYYRLARKTGVWTPRESRTLERATAAQVAHRNAFRTALSDRGEATIDPADLEVVIPAAALTSRPATVTLGRRIEALALHAYLGAVTAIGDGDIRRLFAQVSASEAAQLAYLSGLAGPRVPGDPFPSVHGIETAAEALAAYLP